MPPPRLALALCLAASLSLSVSASSHELEKQECDRLLKALRNHIETIYLFQMANYWRKNEDKEADPPLIVGKRYDEALSHYNSKQSRSGMDVVVAMCPMNGR